MPPSGLGCFYEKQAKTLWPSLVCTNTARKKKKKKKTQWSFYPTDINHTSKNNFWDLQDKHCKRKLLQSWKCTIVDFHTCHSWCFCSSVLVLADFLFDWDQVVTSVECRQMMRKGAVTVEITLSPMEVKTTFYREAESSWLTRPLTAIKSFLHHCGISTWAKSQCLKVLRASHCSHG